MDREDRGNSTAAQAQERKSPGAHVVFEAIRKEGEDELQRRPRELAFSALACGLSMGFSLLAQSLLAAHLPEAPWARLVSALGYTVGFVIVVLGRQQLFTENTLTPVLPWLHAPSADRLRGLLRLWAVVLLGNIAGTALFAWFLAASPAVEPTQHAEMARLSSELLTKPVTLAFSQAILAGWLIALMVWLLPFAESARVLVIMLLTWLIAAAGFPHIIAGAVDAFYAVFAGHSTLARAFEHFFAPALLGNMLGGLLLVAGLNWAQVSGGGTDA
jgi:formate/nitrite transporter FocA (FNT family)